MNRYRLYLFIGISIFFVTCQENRDDQNKPISEKDQYRLIGEEIPFETGLSWIAYYQKQRSSQGRTEILAPYNVSDSRMKELLGSTQNLVGVAFHYGIDESGKRHLIVIPVDESLMLWADIPGRIFVDANTGELISQSTAETWAATFRNAQPNSIWFHFFGAQVFDEILALPFFNSVVIEPAINILTLKPQLLLVIYNDDLLTIGRSESAPPGAIYDASNACPPCAVR